MNALALDLIRRDGGTQPRDHISMEIAQEYAEAIGGGAQFPPVTVFYDGTDYWLADGFHRAAAHELLGLCEIAADVRQGARRDAVLYSVGANASHGYRRSNADKRRAVLTLLNDPEWVKWSDREIASRASVSNRFVSNLRPLTVNVHSDIPARTPEQESEIEKVLWRLGEDQITRDQANRKIATIDPLWSERARERETRTYVTKHGTEAVMNVAAIGKRDDAAAFDWQAANTRNAAISAIKTIADCPPAEDVLAAWSKHTGYGLPVETLDAALRWLGEFRARYPEIEAARAASVSNMLERIENVAS